MTDPLADFLTRVRNGLEADFEYVAAGQVPKVFGGMGTAIMSTSKGVMTGHDARRQGVGGEVVAYVW